MAWRGAVQLEVSVLPSGCVAETQVIASSGHTVLDRAARKAVSRWQFKPATSFGLPIGSRVLVPINFVLG